MLGSLFSWLVTLPLLCRLAGAVQVEPVRLEVGSHGSLQAPASGGGVLDSASFLHQQATDANGPLPPWLTTTAPWSILDGTVENSRGKVSHVVKWPEGNFALQSVLHPNLCLEVQSNCGVVSCDGNCSASGQCRFRFATCDGEDAQSMNFLDDQRVQLTGIVPRKPEESRRFGPTMYPRRCFSEGSADQPANPCNEALTDQDAFYFEYDNNLALRLKSVKTQWCLNIDGLNSDTMYGGSDIFQPCADPQSIADKSAELWTLFPLQDRPLQAPDSSQP